MSNLYIKPEHLDMLYQIFKNYCPEAEIWVYGSRLAGGAHDGSDLDLVVRNFGDENCALIELRQLLNDSNIPFLIDINEFEKLPLSFQKEIEKNYEIIYPESI